MPGSARDVAGGIVRVLRDAGHVAYFAGGCVRDEVLGIPPKDYDVATDATPERVRGLFRRTRAVGAAFGVVLVQEGDVVVEVATFREDGPYEDNRRPGHVVFSTPERDAQRRDFTMNGLFLDPESGAVIDLVGGIEDLRQRSVRAVGDPHARLREDHLRALRAIRFAARYGFTIEPATFDAICEHATELLGVSRERIGDEVRRMLLDPNRVMAAALIGVSGLEAPVLGEGSGVRAWPALGSIRPEVRDYPLALAAWAVDRGLDPADAGARGALVASWRERLCLSNEERERMASVLRALGDVRTAWHGLTVSGQKRLAAEPGFRGALTILDQTHRSLAAGVRARVAELRAHAGGIEPPPLVDGDALVAIGMRPGPGFGRLLAAVYDRQLEGGVSTFEEAIAAARELAPVHGVE